MKLNSEVENRYGSIIMDKPIRQNIFEVQVDFKINSDPDASRGFQAIFTNNEMFEEEFAESQFGYRSDFEGFAVHVFRSSTRQNKWYVMTLQGQGARSMLKQANNL